MSKKEKKVSCGVPGCTNWSDKNSYNKISNTSYNNINVIVTIS